MTNRSLAWLVAATISFGGIGAAAAADLPMKARPMPVPIYNWTGCYVGLSLGAKGAYPKDTATIPTVTTPTITSPTSVADLGRGEDETWLAGGQIGCNYQAVGSHWVFGVEGDAHAQHWTQSSVIGPTTLPLFVAGDQFDLSSRWQASARGRIGYAMDRTLFYATGGAAFTDLNASTFWIPAGIFPGTSASQTKTLTGYTVGAGVEFAATDHITLGMEGRYSNYGTTRFDAGPLAVIAIPGAAVVFARSNTYRDVHLETGEILFKANYKFGPSAIVAKY